jgi:hypothetical protein
MEKGKISKKIKSAKSRDFSKITSLISGQYESFLSLSDVTECKRGVVRPGRPQKQKQILSSLIGKILKGILFPST